MLKFIKMFSFREPYYGPGFTILGTKMRPWFHHFENYTTLLVLTIRRVDVGAVFCVRLVCFHLESQQFSRKERQATPTGERRPPTTSASRRAKAAVDRTDPMLTCSLQMVADPHLWKHFQTTIGVSASCCA